MLGQNVGSGSISLRQPRTVFPFAEYEFLFYIRRRTRIEYISNSRITNDAQLSRKSLHTPRNLPFDISVIQSGSSSESQMKQRWNVSVDFFCYFPNKEFFFPSTCSPFKLQLDPVQILHFSSFREHIENVSSFSSATHPLFTTPSHESLYR